MTGIVWLGRAEVEPLLDVDALLDELRSALRHLSEGTASAPPRVGTVTASGLVGAMPGYLPDAGVAVKLVSVFPDNHERGLPSHQAVIALFDPATGSPLAVMDGTHITAVRTGATAAVAADVLARTDARSLAILGSGVQGHSHLDAFSRVRPPEEIRIASRHAGRAEALAARHDRAVVVPSFEDAVRGADIVCCCTDAPEPVVRREVLAGTRPGRRTADEVTLYKSTGHAVEDVAAAALVYRRALTRGAGTTLAL